MLININDAVCQYIGYEFGVKSNLPENIADSGILL